jgi:hypothetical protein
LALTNGQPLFDYCTSPSGDRAEMTLLSSQVVRVCDFHEKRIVKHGIAVALWNVIVGAVFCRPFMADTQALLTQSTIGSQQQ